MTGGKSIFLKEKVYTFERERCFTGEPDAAKYNPVKPGDSKYSSDKYMKDFHYELKFFLQN